MPVNFAEVLDIKAEDIKEPTPLPPGMYLMRVEGFPTFPEEGIGKNQTPGAYVTCKYIQAGSGVDQAAIAEAGGLEGKTIRMTLWLSPDAQYRTIEFARDKLGVDVTNKSLREIFSEFPNRQFYAQIGHRPAGDGKRLFNDIKDTSAA